MTTPTFMQNDPRLTRLLAQQQAHQKSIDRANSGAPIRTGFGALARVLTSALGEYGNKKVSDKIDSRKGELTSELAALLNGGAGGAGGAGNGMAVTEGSPDSPPADTIKALAMSLINNPSTADMGLNLFTQNMVGDKNFGRQMKIAEMKANAPKKPSNRDNIIRDYVARGFHQNDAQDIADKVVELKQDDATGDFMLVNLATGVSKPLNISKAGEAGSPGTSGGMPQQPQYNQPAQQPQQPQQPGQPQSEQPAPQYMPPLTKERRKEILDNQSVVNEALNLARGFSSIVESGTGPYAAMAEGADTLAGLVGGRAFEDTVENRNKVRQFGQEIKRALAKNPRFPVAEMEQIQLMLPDADAFFTNPKAQVANLKNLLQMLDTKSAQNSAQLEGRPFDNSNNAMTNPSAQRTATDKNGNKVRWNINSKQWERF